MGNQTLFAINYAYHLNMYYPSEYNDTTWINDSLTWIDFNQRYIYPGVNMVDVGWNPEFLSENDIERNNKDIFLSRLAYYL